MDNTPRDKGKTMNSLDFIIKKFNLTEKDLAGSPTEIPNAGRANLALLFAELGYKKGIEVGTAGGRYAELLCLSNPEMELFCVDAYKVYNGYRDYTRTDEMDDMREEAHKRLEKYPVEFIENFSMDAVDLFADNSLDFVYIDANHEWAYITQDLYYWSKKIRPGGIISGHDFYRSNRKDSKCHVRGAVLGYAYAFRLSPWFVLGRDEKRAGEVRDNSRSYFWVKE